NIGRDGEEQDDNGDERMLQDLREAAPVGVEQSGEKLLARTVGFAVVFGRAVAQEARAHHGRGGEGDEQRDHDGGGEHHGELAEQAADDTAHQQDGEKDDDEGDADGKDGEADFARALEGGVPRVHAAFDVAGDVLDDHDGVVDDEAGGDGEGHEG